MTKPSSDADQGGLGGKSAITINPSLGARDVRLVEKALRQRFPIPEEIRAILGEELANIVTNREESTRARTAAARALIAADQLNLEQEKRDAGGEVVNVNLKGQIQTEVVETIVRTREEANRLPAVNGTSSVPGLNGAH